MALLSMGLVACNQDFDTEFVPQTNMPESLLQMSDVSVAAQVPSTLNLADYINGKMCLNSLGKIKSICDIMKISHLKP